MGPSNRRHRSEAVSVGSVTRASRLNAMRPADRLAPYSKAALAKAALGVRPEHIFVHGTEKKGVTIPAVADVHEPMGADSLLWLNVGDHFMSARVAAEEHLPMGTKCHIEMNISKSPVFDAATETRILGAILHERNLQADNLKILTTD